MSRKIRPSFGLLIVLVGALTQTTTGLQAGTPQVRLTSPFITRCPGFRANRVLLLCEGQDGVLADLAYVDR